jgi:hypothetical protein
MLIKHFYSLITDTFAAERKALQGEIVLLQKELLSVKNLLEGEYPKSASFVDSKLSLDKNKWNEIKEVS